jgi:hypothetical protein
MLHGGMGSNVDRLVLAVRHTVFESGNTVNEALLHQLLSLVMLANYNK